MPDEGILRDLLHQHEEHATDLRRRVHLPPDTRTEVPQRRRHVQQRAHHQDDDVPAEYRYGQPPRYAVRERQHQEQRAQQQLVRYGIEVLPQQRPLVEPPRQQPIPPVTHPRYDQQDERPQVPPLHDGHSHERHEHQPEQRELVGGSPELG